MIAGKILALIGLCAPQRPDEAHLTAALRRANAAFAQNRSIHSQTRSDALDRIDRAMNDPRPAEIEKSAEQMKETLAEMLGRME